jgi:hypothetical protein
MAWVCQSDGGQGWRGWLDSVDRTDQILRGGLRSNGALEVRSESFGSRLCQDGSSERKSPGSAECESGPFFLGPTLGPTRPGFRQLFRG